MQKKKKTLSKVTDSSENTSLSSFFCSLEVYNLRGNEIICQMKEHNYKRLLKILWEKKYTFEVL